ncbi:Mss4-like protein [Lentinula lateritia]|uniref:Mss4-like protein n=1 Tax=Lentinula aff. lateritia TaxID=2804960 RepID=A0ACC1TX16_9AGAR|nr:Mss4-like protein [Lentinula aff. lateritia]KAJ3852403.1 Mss4-like protein [Lentinula lateritia]
MPFPFHGTCLCGGITFQVDNDPIVTTCCHCSNCKKYTGTVFTTNVVFPAGVGSLTITKGENLLSTYRDATQDSGNALKRIFCSQCGSPLYNNGGDAGKTLAVFYSALIDFGTEDQKDPKPELEYYTKDRVAWVHAVEGAEQARTKPGRD